VGILGNEIVSEQEGTGTNKNRVRPLNKHFMEENQKLSGCETLNQNLNMLRKMGGTHVNPTSLSREFLQQVNELQTAY
jgi:hypothetical protein